MRSVWAAVLVAAISIALLPAPAGSQTHVTAPRHSRASAISPQLPDGVTAKDIHFYSEGIQCYGRIFLPKGLSSERRLPAVVLAPGWGETAGSVEKYAGRFASRGLVAMTIDYRGWGRSGGFLQTVDPVKTDDRLRFSQMTARVRVLRRRLIPQHQILDIRNALYYLQGEPGVDRARLGVWGAGMAGGHVIVIAATDSRVKAAVAHAPVLEGKNTPMKASAPTGELLLAEQRRARRQFPSGDAAAWTALETRLALADYHPFWYVEQIPQTTAVLFVIPDKESAVNNESNATAASKLLKGPAGVLSVPAARQGGSSFEQAANAAADWFLKHLGST